MILFPCQGVDPVRSPNACFKVLSSRLLFLVPSTLGFPPHLKEVPTYSEALLELVSFESLSFSSFQLSFI